MVNFLWLEYPWGFKKNDWINSRIQQPHPLNVPNCHVLSLSGKGLFDAKAAIVEADDDVELLEKVKKDRKKRLEKQRVISSSTKETGNVHYFWYEIYFSC